MKVSPGFTLTAEPMLSLDHALRQLPQNSALRLLVGELVPSRRIVAECVPWSFRLAVAHASRVGSRLRRENSPVESCPADSRSSAIRLSDAASRRLEMIQRGRRGSPWVTAASFIWKSSGRSLTCLLNVSVAAFRLSIGLLQAFLAHLLGVRVLAPRRFCTPRPCS